MDRLRLEKIKTILNRNNVVLTDKLLSDLMDLLESEHESGFYEGRGEE